MEKGIKAQLPGRTDNEIKNLWKKLRQPGIDPNTHKPLTVVNDDRKDPSGSNEKNSQGSSYLDEKIEPPVLVMASYYPLIDNPPPVRHEFLFNMFVTSHETTTKQTDSHHLSRFIPFRYTQQPPPPPTESTDIFFNTDSKP
ncbi:unnamed protein product [Lactuca virosa]|uniref:HTH myb-type domain-containing protein n=1 Tax=Lactuca virosa TaxID=75947 RepID=A0AAU9PBM9_9ASTR|nr:unnamed protein product [Lactuca virosa]